LRSRSNLSSQNWIREKEELQGRETNLKSEFESAKQAMQDWEILAMEERSIRENLTERVSELEEQLTTHREAHERLESERATQAQTVEGLQRALQELQEGENRGSVYKILANAPQPEKLSCVKWSRIRNPSSRVCVRSLKKPRPQHQKRPAPKSLPQRSWSVYSH
jgi:hypothetical protein